jgi:hypothetical protein
MENKNKKKEKEKEKGNFDKMIKKDFEKSIFKYNSITEKDILKEKEKIDNSNGEEEKEKFID